MNKKIKFLMTICLSGIVLSCSNGQNFIDPATPEPSPTVTVTVTPSPSPVVPPETVSSEIQSIVNEQNAYRLSIGQEELVPGLDCVLYTVPTTTTGIAGATLTTVGGWTYNGVFNQSNGPSTTGSKIMPLPLSEMYQNWYVVKCYGTLVVVNNAYHSFTLMSDDGSNLYIDGGLIINNDGLHAAQTKGGVKFLSYGVHSFELDYFQATGQEELILQEDSAVMPFRNFYH